MMSTARLAHLQAVPGEGIRVGDPNGPHVLLTPQAVRVHRVKDDAAGTVEFEAHHRGPDGPDVLHENSRFAKRAGRWFYTAPVEDA